MARDYALRALALDSMFGEANMVLAFIDADGGDIPAARRAAARAEREAPYLRLFSMATSRRELEIRPRRAVRCVR